MDPNSEFQKAIVEYLESVHQEEFITGSIEDVHNDVAIAEGFEKYQPPTHNLPEPPPPSFFMLGHQQADTHSVCMKKDEGLIVPNFVGGILPHCDQGD